MNFTDRAELDLMPPLQQVQLRKAECEQCIAHIDNDDDPDMPQGEALRASLRASCEAMIRMYDKQIALWTPKEVVAEDLV